MFPGLDRPRARLEVSVAIFAMKPASRGSVRLTAPTRARRWPSTMASWPMPRDAAVLAEGVEVVRRLAADDPVRATPGRRLRPGAAVAADAHVRASARGFFHPVATCAIGRVVDGDGRVYGLDGLFVADASIMPTIPRANTNLSTLALAERLAERIAGATS